MRFELTALLLAPIAIFALPLEVSADTPDIALIPTVKQAAVQARQLLKTESIGTLSTIYPEDERHGLGGQPVGLMDYFADCSTDGNPTLLAMDISTSYVSLSSYMFTSASVPTDRRFKNAKDGAAISLSIRSHKESWSAASQPRLSLIGKLSSKVPRHSEEAARLKECFTTMHKDAKIWSPGNLIHDSDWVTFEVETIYWIGGFGNVAYIGFIPVELYNNVTLEEIEAEEESTAKLGMAVQRGLGSLKGLFRKD